MTLEEFEAIVSYMEGGYSDGNHRKALTSLAEALGFTIAHDEPGQYDPSIDGYIVVTDGDRNLKIDFQEDSYNGGQVKNSQWVIGLKKEVTVWV